MKRQTLMMILVFVVLAIALTTTALTLQPRTRPSGPAQVVSLGELTLSLPSPFGQPCPSRHEGWKKALYSGGFLGNLLLATEPADGRTPAEAYREWFSMPGYAPGPMRYAAGGSSWFFQEVPLFGQGAYVLQKHGKTLRFIACFTQHNTRHWVQLETRNTTPGAQQLFRELLLSLRLPDGSQPGPALAAALDTIPRETRWRFIFPMELPFLLPLVVLVLVFGVQLTIRGRSGRVPDLPGTPHTYLEGGLEVALTGPMQLQFLDAAVGVTPQSLTIYTFGTPFLILPRASLAGRVTTGQGWFGAKFLLLDLEGPLAFQKYKWKFRANQGAKLKIYAQDETRLYFALMN